MPPGHYRLAIPNGVGQLGLALFVYCVGLSAGNRFFSAIAKQGSKLAVMSAVIVGVSALFTCLCGIWFNVPAGISSGIFAGACTSTPALAAATESLPGASGSGVSIGYGIAYPFGVVGVVLFVQLLPRLLHFDLHKEARAMHAKQEASIISRLVRVNQPNLLGQNIADCKLLDGLHCMVTRVVRDGRLCPDAGRHLPGRDGSPHRRQQRYHARTTSRSWGKPVKTPTPWTPRRNAAN